MKKILPLVLAIVGLGAGVGAGVFLKPAPPEEPEMADACADAAAGGDGHADADCPPPPPKAYAAEVAQSSYDPEAVWEYVKMPKQFVIPIIKNDRVAALVVMSVSIEVSEGGGDAVTAKQPKLRDSFLQVMFKHANSGGFDGAFTGGRSMTDLRGSLKEVAQMILGDVANDILIEEIVKQTM